MAYKDLRKIYYEDRETHEYTFRERFSSDTAIHLDFDVAGKLCFFVQCDDVIKLTYQVLTLDKEIKAISSQLPQKALDQYSKKCLIDEIVITNDIEGVNSSRKEVGDVLEILQEQSEKTGKKSVYLGLVNKYLKLLSNEKVRLQTCQDIRDIYDEIVLEEVVSEDKKNAPDGQYFRKDLTEVRSATGKPVHKGKYPESEIIQYMEKALRYLNDEAYLPLYRICLFHYMLEYIHPFYDGNGRLGRFILSYWISENLEKIVSFRISETIKENLKKYYEAFTTCNDERNCADLTPFLIMMLGMIEQAMVDLKDSLNRKLSDLKHYHSAIVSVLNGHKECESLSYVLVQASLFSEQGISTQELLSIYKTNYVTLGSRLALIGSKGILINKKNGRKKYYMIDLKKLDHLTS